MKSYVFEAKTIADAKEKALNELRLSEENIIIKTQEEKQGLLKKTAKIKVISVNDLINYLKESLNTITSLMNINTNLEVRRRDKNIEIKIFSDQNPILIGKDGKTLEALQNILRQVLLKEVGDEYKILLDIENYKEKKITNLERVAKKLAREVKKTKVEIKLDRMNSYERRIIHNTLADNEYVYTESIGEEPNRYVVIKPKEEI
ncbi:MAG: KH domain-containing protein [Erysipelotrichaceae bacterium]|nr:KH domain-containing protein [Erysipelotrichaceae bacterium]